MPTIKEWKEFKKLLEDNKDMFSALKDTRSSCSVQFGYLPCANRSLSCTSPECLKFLINARIKLAEEAQCLCPKCENCCPKGK
jgi:hypothetical protein